MISEKNSKIRSIEDIARKMVIAARTAPKGRGADSFIFSIADQRDIKKISNKMQAIGRRYQAQVFLRDAKNILKSPYLVLLGTVVKPLGLRKCGMCGFRNCQEKDKNKDIPCVFNTGDLGIAIGSAVSIAADHRVDNRVLYTAGFAAMKLGLLGKDIKVAYAIALSADSKNPFFDRA